MMEEKTFMYETIGNLQSEIEEIEKFENMEKSMDDVVSITVGCSGLFTVICC